MRDKNVMADRPSLYAIAGGSWFIVDEEEGISRRPMNEITEEEEGARHVGGDEERDGA